MIKIYCFLNVLLRHRFGGEVVELQRDRLTASLATSPPAPHADQFAAEAACRRPGSAAILPAAGRHQTGESPDAPAPVLCRQATAAPACSSRYEQQQA